MTDLIHADHMLVSEFVRTELLRFIANHRLPPFNDLSEEFIADELARQIATSRATVSSNSNQGTTASLNTLLAIVEKKTATAWTQIRTMLTGRARVQLCMMDVPPRFETPEDIAHAVITKARESHEQFRGQSEAEYRSWIKKILDRHLIERVRALRKGQRAELRMISVEEQCERFSTQNGVKIEDHRNVTGSEAARRKEAVDLLFEAIERLSNDERRVVAEKLAERTFDEIARDIGLPKTTVVRRYHSALATLRQELEELK